MMIITASMIINMVVMMIIMAMLLINKAAVFIITASMIIVIYTMLSCKPAK